MNIKNGCKHCNQPHDPGITCRLAPGEVDPVEFVFEAIHPNNLETVITTVTVSGLTNSMTGEFALHIREALEAWTHLPVVWVR